MKKIALFAARPVSEKLVSVHVVDQVQKLSIQLCVVREPFLYVLHQFHQQDGLLLQVGTLVEHFHVLVLHPVLKHFGDGLHHFYVRRLLNQPNQDGADKKLPHILTHH